MGKFHLLQTVQAKRMQTKKMQNKKRPHDCNERLLEASRSGRIREAQKLLDAGTDVNTCSDGMVFKETVGERGGGTPLSLACEGGHLGVIETPEPIQFVGEACPS